MTELFHDSENRLKSCTITFYITTTLWPSLQDTYTIFYTTIARILMYIIYNKKIVLDLYSLYNVVFIPNDCMVQYFCIFTVGGTTIHGSRNCSLCAVSFGRNTIKSGVGWIDLFFSMANSLRRKSYQCVWGVVWKNLAEGGGESGMDGYARRPVHIILFLLHLAFRPVKK